MSHVSWERRFTTSTFSIFCFLISLPFYYTYSLQPHWTAKKKWDYQDKNHKILTIKHIIHKDYVAYFYTHFLSTANDANGHIFWEI